MFLIDIIDLFKSLLFIQYIFVAFGFFGVMLCLKKIILNRGV